MAGLGKLPITVPPLAINGGSLVLATSSFRSRKLNCSGEFWLRRASTSTATVDLGRPTASGTTYICLRLMEGADIYQIAKNCHTSVEMIEKYYAAHIKNRIDAVDQRHATAQVQTENRKPSAYEIANSTNDLGYNIRNLGW